MAEDLGTIDVNAPALPPARPSDFGVAPIPPARPDISPSEAPIPPSRPSDVGNPKPAGDEPTNPQQGKPREGYALAEMPPGGPLDIVTLLVNGKMYGGWEKATVTASVDDAHRAFTVTTSEHPPDWPIKPQDEVTVYVNYEDIVCKGVVEVYAAELSENMHVARIDGASASVDAVDSAAGGEDDDDNKGIYRDMTIKQIGEAIAKDNSDTVKFVDKTNNGLKKIERFQLQAGETIYDATERIARSQNLHLIGGADGSIEIHDGPEKMSKVALIEGYWPVLKISVKLSVKDRYQTTKVKGQRAHSSDKDDLKVEGKVKDSSVKRKRTKVIIAEGDIDTDRARARALNDLNKQQGDGTSATIECSGWYAPDGKLWRPMQLVYVSFPTVHLDQTMGIKQIVWNKEENSKTYTRLELVDPKALNGEEDKKSKSDEPYKFKDAPASPPPPSTPTNPPPFTPVQGGFGFGAGGSPTPGTTRR